MLYQLKGNPKKVNEYKKRVKDLKEVYKEDEEMLHFLNSLCVNRFEDILNPLYMVKGFEDSPVGFYLTRWYNSENDLFIADMQVKDIQGSDDAWLFSKKRTSHRLELKYGKEKGVKGVNYALSGLSKYGVCDNAHQVIAYYKPFWGELLNNQNKKYIVLMTPVLRAEEEAVGGWRWHKWGKYIGNQKPQHEYLYDDKHIDLVFTYNIIEVEKLK